MDKFTAGQAGLEARVVDNLPPTVVDNLWISVTVPLGGLVGWLAGWGAGVMAGSLT